MHTYNDFSSRKYNSKPVEYMYMYNKHIISTYMAIGRQYLK